MNTVYRSIFLIIFTLININATLYAGPIIKLCVNKNCKKPVNIQITDACWTDVKSIFSDALSTDKDEQDNMVSAAALIESDIYQSMAKQSPGASTANDLYVSNSPKNNYRNMKKYLIVLLDHYLVKRHLMRKTISRRNWYGLNEYALLLQSLTDSKLYVLKIDPIQLGNSAIIRGYKDSTSDTNSNNALQKDTTPSDEDFE